MRFTPAWEQRKLGEIVTEVKRNDCESTAPIMMITASNGFIEQSDRYAFNNAGESLNKYILLKRGELAYNHGASKIRPYGSCFSLTTREYARIPFVYHCFSVEGNDSEFISIELNSSRIENQLRQIVSSGARMDGLLNISFEEYSGVQLMLPKVEEQSIISDYIRTIDTLITLHQREQRHNLEYPTGRLLRLCINPAFTSSCTSHIYDHAGLRFTKTVDGQVTRYRYKGSLLIPQQRYEGKNLFRFGRYIFGSWNKILFYVLACVEKKSSLSYTVYKENNSVNCIVCAVV